MIRLDKDLIMLNSNGEQIPVYIEGAAPAVLPDEYFTVSEDSTSNAVSADNKALERLYEFTLKWYTKDATRLYTGLLDPLIQPIGIVFSADRAVIVHNEADATVNEVIVSSLFFGDKTLRPIVQSRLFNTLLVCCNH